MVFFVPTYIKIFSADMVYLNWLESLRLLVLVLGTRPVDVSFEGTQYTYSVYAFLVATTLRDVVYFPLHIFQFNMECVSLWNMCRLSIQLGSNLWQWKLSTGKYFFELDCIRSPPTSLTRNFSPILKMRGKF